jgi:hypothetical protein
MQTHNLTCRCESELSSPSLMCLARALDGSRWASLTVSSTVTSAVPRSPFFGRSSTFTFAASSTASSAVPSTSVPSAVSSTVFRPIFQPFRQSFLRPFFRSFRQPFFQTYVSAAFLRNASLIVLSRESKSGTCGLTS